MNALELLLKAQTELNAAGITEKVATFLRAFFSGLAYTEDASEYLFTLKNKDGGYYFRVAITQISVDIDWDVSKNDEWCEIGNEELQLLFINHCVESIIDHIEREFQAMTAKCYLIQPELKTEVATREAN